MRSLFAGLVAVVLAGSFTTAVAQGIDLGPNAPKAKEQREKQRADAAKGQRRAVEAEAKLKAEAAALAPKLITAGKVTCTPTNVEHLLGVGQNLVIEVACAEGPGFQAVSASDGSNATISPCLPIPGTVYPLGSGCQLASNSEEAVLRTLQPLANRAGGDCQVRKGLLIGRTAESELYEVACASGVGQILQASVPKTDSSRVIAQTCMRIFAVVNYTCALTTPAANAAPIDALAGKAGRPCTVSNRRYVAATTGGSEYYEFACNEGAGFMVEANAKGEFVRAVTCVQAAGIGGGCTLSDAAGELASANANYSNLIKTAGFDCQVSKFRTFKPQEGSNLSDIIEAGCSNRPESVFAMIGNGKAEVLNCVRARVEGFQCTYSTPEQSHALLTADLRKAGRTTCDVNGARVMGTGRNAAYVEVACSDGAPGFVISYPLGVGKPTEAISCGLASSIGGGCQLPTNKRS
jgi:hypothetical protein